MYALKRAAEKKLEKAKEIAKENLNKETLEKAKETAKRFAEERMDEIKDRDKIRDLSKDIFKSIKNTTNYKLELYNKFKNLSENTGITDFVSMKSNIYNLKKFIYEDLPTVIKKKKEEINTLKTIHNEINNTCLSDPLRVDILTPMRPSEPPPLPPKPKNLNEDSEVLSELKILNHDLSIKKQLYNSLIKEEETQIEAIKKLCKNLLATHINKIPTSCDIKITEENKKYLEEIQNIINKEDKKYGDRVKRIIDKENRQKLVDEEIEQCINHLALPNDFETVDAIRLGIEDQINEKYCEQHYPKNKYHEKLYNKIESRKPVIQKKIQDMREEKKRRQEEALKIKKEEQEKKEKEEKYPNMSMHIQGKYPNMSSFCRRFLKNGNINEDLIREYNEGEYENVISNHTELENANPHLYTLPEPGKITVEYCKNELGMNGGKKRKLLIKRR